MAVDSELPFFVRPGDPIEAAMFSRVLAAIKRYEQHPNSATFGGSLVQRLVAKSGGDVTADIEFSWAIVSQTVPAAKFEDGEFVRGGKRAIKLGVSKASEDPLSTVKSGALILQPDFFGDPDASISADPTWLIYPDAPEDDPGFSGYIDCVNSDFTPFFANVPILVRGEKATINLGGEIGKKQYFFLPSGDLARHLDYAQGEPQVLWHRKAQSDDPEGSDVTRHFFWAGKKCSQE